MTMTRDKIEELKRLARDEVTTSGTLNLTLLSLLRSRSPDESFNILGSLADAVVAMTVALAERALNTNPVALSEANAERALEPQGQALPESCEMTPEQMTAYAQSVADRASQLALPAGPVPEGFVLVPMHLNAEMREVLSEEDWTWEDLLVAANAVTEEQYYAIQNGDDSSPAVAQPVADERGQVAKAAAELLEETVGELKAAHTNPITGKIDDAEVLDVISQHEFVIHQLRALCQPAEEGDKA